MAQNADLFKQISTLDMPGTGKLIVLAILTHKTHDVARLMELTGENRRTVQMYKLQWLTLADETRESDEAGCANFAKDAKPVAQGAQNVSPEPSRVEDNNITTNLETTVEKIDTPKPPKLGKAEALEAFNAYNAVALKCALPQASKLTPDREKKILARLKEYGLDGWNQALANIEKSSFLCGETEQRFRADLDFVCQAKSFGKLHDGGYGNGRHAKTTAKPKPAGLSTPNTVYADPDAVRKLLEDAVRGYA